MFLAHLMGTDISCAREASACGSKERSAAAAGSANLGLPCRPKHHGSETDWKFWACKNLTASRIGSGEIRITLPKPCSSSRNIATAPATANADSVRMAAEVKLSARTGQNWRTA